MMISKCSFGAENCTDQSANTERKNISFWINGKKHEVSNRFPLNTSINHYIRDVLNLTGTKITCREGGCGACIVSAEIYGHEQKKHKTFTINSCLYPLYSCDNLKITTVEGLGRSKEGHCDIQKRLADNNGSQCGWCSSGIVMNMYGVLSNNPKPTKNEIESSFDGNICRCTGYRAILDSMKSFAVDETPIDIEELAKIKCLTQSCCQQNCESRKGLLHIKGSNSEWYAPQSLSDLLNLIKSYKEDEFWFIGGNTGSGVNKKSVINSNIFIDLKNIPELYEVQRSQSELTVGSSVTIASLIEIFEDFSKNYGFSYLLEVAGHLKKVGNTAIRNVASWSGNLVLKHEDNMMSSDLFLVFLSVDATLNLLDKNGTNIKLNMIDFLKSNIEGKLIHSISLKSLDPNRVCYKTYRVSPRSKNAYAYVNAAFNIPINPDSKLVEQGAIISFGGISPSFVRASKTESYLVGKNINDEKVFKEVLNVLHEEIVPTENISVREYRRKVAVSLFYKYLIQLNDKLIGHRYRSVQGGLVEWRNKVKSSKQQYPDVNQSLYPVTKRLPKLNSRNQTSGEAEYVYDMPNFPNQLNGAFIQTDLCNCKILNIDTTEALKMEGVVRIILAKDIPGSNDVMIPDLFFQYEPEKLFCDDYVEFTGQPAGLVIAETYEQAVNAAKAVKISYLDIKKPILTIEEAIEQNSYHNKLKLTDFTVGDVSEAFKNSDHVIEGKFSQHGQYHFFMEQLVGIAKKSDMDYDIYSSTQWTSHVQHVVAQVLGLKNCSFVNVHVKQVGGGYGAKISRASATAAAAALGCKLTDRAVKVALDMDTSMEVTGKRTPWLTKYKVGFNKDGKINAISMDWFCDGGCAQNDNPISYNFLYADNAYNIANWRIVPKVVKTNTPCNTSNRGPFSFSAINMMENIIEHIASHLNMDGLKVRIKNLYKVNDTAPYGQQLPYFNVDRIINELVISSDYENRLKDMNEFNLENRWLKKGLSLTPLKWGIPSMNIGYLVHLNVYSFDGSVGIMHSGIEIGQGLHTKLAQVCAYSLKIPIDKVSVKYSNTLVNPNGLFTGGSMTSELVSLSLIECCRILNESLEPIKQAMPEKYSWEELVSKAASSGVELTVKARKTISGNTVFAYHVYGAAVSESIVDVLTGEVQVLRTDILYDCGESTNSMIDIGQAEGGFMMGLGYFLLEKPLYDSETGKALSNRAWEYKVPLAQDVPVDLRITLLDKNPNPLGVLGSKCVGEPPLCLSPSVFFSVKNAIGEARKEIGISGYFELNTPATCDYVQEQCLIDLEHLKIKD